MLKDIDFPKDLRLEQEPKIHLKDEIIEWQQEYEENEPAIDKKYTIKSNDSLKYIDGFKNIENTIIDNHIEHIVVAFNESDYVACHKYIQQQPHKQEYAIVFAQMDFSDVVRCPGFNTFANSIFTETVKIHCQNNRVIFKNCLFLKELYIECDTHLSLEQCIVYDKVTLKHNDINTIKIDKCYFSDDIKVYGENIHAIGVEKVRFEKDFQIENAHLDSIDIFDVRCKNFDLCRVHTKFLNIHDTDIEKIGFEKMDVQFLTDKQNTIKSAKTYQDFTVLKNFAIANKNNIQALEYIVPEMDTHLQQLISDKKMTANRIILTFEKYVSYFGSQPILPAIWLILFFYFKLFMIQCVLWAFFLFIVLGFLLYFRGKQIISSTICQFLIFLVLFACAASWKNPFTEFILFNKLIGTPVNGDDVPHLTIWMLLEVAISSALIYEIVKSFRKYSRQL